MNLTETLEKHVAELQSTIVECSTLEHTAIGEINSISQGDVRGQTPELSDRIKQLDEERRVCVERRRALMSELSRSRATLDKARSILR
jgi:hypothetical protein